MSDDKTSHATEELIASLVDPKRIMGGLSFLCSNKVGPGHIKQAHTWDEWIAVEQLDRGADLYEKLIRHCCC